MNDSALASAPSTSARRVRVRVRGVVQGVGFRPFVFGLARRYDLAGWVKNDDAGVLLEVEGPLRDTERFLHALNAEVPPLGRIDSLEIERAEAAPETAPGRSATFHIDESSRSTSVTTGIGPDAAPCRACLHELFDPSDRRYRYPFLNCTHCGPRFTITKQLPYDRAQTSMAGFAMCPACDREYHDPLDRRFHAQPTACPKCGPQLSMSVEAIAASLSHGQAVALKALGGFQIACDARDHEVVLRLRRLKERGGKPFAVMVPNVASARLLVSLTTEEEQWLTSVKRPIVIAKAKADAGLAPDVAPDLAWLGVMLPSSPLHYLVFHELLGRPRGLEWLDDAHSAALVMTSANHGGEPLLIDDERARCELADLTGDVAGHDRTVVARCDDPVVRVVTPDAPLVVRRGRGFVPEGIVLGRSYEESVLATGAFLKNAICMTRGDRAFLSAHLGDMDDVETYRFFEETIARFRALFEVEPSVVAHDLHPDFLSTRYAEGLGVPTVAVQHHHAHVAAVLAEHGREEPTLGLALDGVGLGTDGQAWGGEMLWVDGSRFERVGHLAPLPLPGGDAAAREPWRMAAAALFLLGEPGEIAQRWGKRGAMLAALLEAQARSPNPKPITTGCGRWFDAASALLGVRDRSGYEGEAPMVLESLVQRPRSLEGAWRITERDGRSVLDLLPLLHRLRTMTPEDGADAFHGTLAAALVDLATQELDRRGARVVALGGGCIINAALTEGLLQGFTRRGVSVLLPKQAPPGDGGLALGQAWVALRELARAERRGGWGGAPREENN